MFGGEKRAGDVCSLIMRKRRHVIPLRLTEKELQYLKRQAEQSGMSREKFLRALIMGETIHPRPCTHHATLIARICRSRWRESA